MCVHVFHMCVIIIIIIIIVGGKDLNFYVGS